MAIGTIASKAKASARLFDELCSLPDIDSTARTVLVDQSSSFQIWAANIGALQEPPLPSSLDHRLREAPKVADQIKGLLEDLIETLQEILPIVTGDRTNRTGSVDDVVSESRALNNADNDAASLSSDQSQPVSELDELLKSCTDTVTGLFRSSVLIRSATTRDRYAKATAAQGKPFDPHFDIGHVEHKFPRLNQADWLKKRLGIANTQRRQYLRYCREHRQRMTTEKSSIDVDEGAQDIRMTTMKDHQKSIGKTSKSYTSSKPPSALAVTNASTLDVGALHRLEEVSDEAQSQTSYATSLGVDENSDCLRVPTIPENARSGLPFECPYCWTIQTFTNSRKWKKHVFQDLRPYVCTFESCDLKVFADRSSWFNHELQAHRVEWCCPFCPHLPFRFFKSFEGHLASRHTRLFSRDQLEPLAEACKNSVDKISPQACLFCEEWLTNLQNANPGMSNLVVTIAQFQHHVGSHMEQLALFALPRDFDKEDISADAVAGHDNHLDFDLGSQASYDNQENPPLHIAAYEGLEEEILQLLSDGSDIEAPGQTWGHVLTAAIIGGQTSIVRLLLDHGAKADGHAGPFGLPLQAATQKGDDVSIQLLQDAWAMYPAEFTVGWICALPLELTAARGMCDKEHGDRRLRKHPRDTNMYCLGLIAGHKVVLTCLASAGSNHASSAALHMRDSFENMRFILMVGIGGGIPSTENDVRLGDVVVSMPSGEYGGVVQYDSGIFLQDGVFKRIGALKAPPQHLQKVVKYLISVHESKKICIARHIQKMLLKSTRAETNYGRPKTEFDLLFKAEYVHEGYGNTCENCDKTQLITRSDRDEDEPVMHYGNIASGSGVFRDAIKRDQLGMMYDALCVEMEAAGLIDELDCLVIRGICDYSDSHKNKDWQRYAAAAAASYAKELLGAISTIGS